MESRMAHAEPATRNERDNAGLPSDRAFRNLQIRSDVQAEAPRGHQAFVTMFERPDRRSASSMASEPAGHVNFHVDRPRSCVVLVSPV